MKILIVDDEKAIRELLKVNLQRSGYEATEADNGQRALDMVRSEHFDLILLDVMLPEIDGLEVCRHLKAAIETSSLPIIMLTARAEEIDRVLGLELGADDYITKPFSVRELLARIKAVLRRTKELPSQGRLSVGKLIMDFEAYTAELSGKVLSLTPKEFELLKLFVTNRGRAFSRDELLSRIWGYDYYGDARTVDVHIRHLRVKLSAGSLDMAQAVETVRGVGYRFSLAKI